MAQLLPGLVTEFVADVIRQVARRIPWWRKDNKPYPFRFPRKHDLLFIYPQRETREGAIIPDVAGEDFMAIVNLMKPLAMAKFPQDRIRMVASDHSTDRSPNLILVCGSWRNALTKDLLTYLSEHRHFDVEFEIEDHPLYPGSDLKRKNLRVLGVHYPSTSYTEQAALVNRPATELWKEKFTDTAFIVSIDNPWSDRNTRILAVAGTRGFGTWGAAVFLSTYGKRQFVHTGVQQRDFAAVLKIVYSRLEILETSVVASWDIPA